MSPASRSVKKSGEPARERCFEAVGLSETSGTLSALSRRLAELNAKPTLFSYS